MAYPQAPWTLKGYALQTVHLIDVADARPLIPPELDIVSVFPGKTIGGVYLSYYGQSPVMEYSELIVAPGMVSHSGKVGGWVSHIYVDNPDSVAGGREIWGLPKEMADFTWERDDSSGSGYSDRVTVRQGERTLCRLRYSQQGLGLPLPLSFYGFSTQDSKLLAYKADLESRLGLVSSNLEIPSESPFGNLGLKQPWLTGHCKELRLVVNAPEVVQQRGAEFSYQ
ncbi:MAG: acetoacetate decarboxylase family protein [Kastovskya adunca ATA6-11-RM4]|jgi:acetoacetate decarboxylase|nr:acetoacetate decarboxylase family protein [Kastovskya adunca ATA6-11-RM4]